MAFCKIYVFTVRPFLPSLTSTTEVRAQPCWHSESKSKSRFDVQMEDNLRHRTSLLSSLHAVKGIFPQRFCSNEVRSDLVFPLLSL